MLFRVGGISFISYGGSIKITSAFIGAFGSCVASDFVNTQSLVMPKLAAFSLVTSSVRWFRSTNSNFAAPREAASKPIIPVPQ